MAMLSVNGLSDLSTHLNEFSNQLVVLYFYIEDSSECVQMCDAVSELIKNTEEDKAVAIKINSSKEEEICKEYEITSVPAVTFVLDGKVVDSVVGANVPQLSKKFEEHLKSLQENINEQLKKLINKAPVMLFMKGNPSAPRCGFSKQVIALLTSHNAKFETFDILEDYEVREALKKFSNWPTYPQLYVKGELIGGLDILKEYSESGELDSILSG